MAKPSATFTVVSLFAAFAVSTVACATGMQIASSVLAGGPIALVFRELWLSPLPIGIVRDLAPYTLAASALLVCVALVYALRQGVIKSWAVSAALSVASFVTVSLASLPLDLGIVAAEFMAILAMVSVAAGLGAFVGAAVHPLLKRSVKFGHDA